MANYLVTVKLEVDTELPVAELEERVESEMQSAKFILDARLSANVIVRGAKAEVL